jgi:exopolysaccharide production protein ExoQ
MSIDDTGSGGRLSWRAEPGSLEGLIARIGQWVPALMLAYVLAVWPLVFGDPLPSLQDETLGWMVAVHEPDTGIWKQIAYPLFFMLALAAALASAAYRTLPWRSFGFVVLLALMAWALGSVLWSIDWHMTLLRAVLFAMIIATLALSTAAAPSSGSVITRVFWVMAVVAMLNAAALVVRPPSSIGHTGIYDHKNVFGWVSVLVLYFGLYGLLAGGKIERLAAAFMTAAAMMFLIAAESKTSLGLPALCITLGTLLWVGARRFRLSPAIPVAVLAITLAFVFEIGRASGTWDLFAVNRAIFGNETLTGRTDIWAFTLSLIGDRPWHGYGYEAVFATGVDGIVNRNASGFVRVMPSAHNGYLDIWVQLGLVGLAGLVLFLLAVFHAMGRWAQVRPALAWFGITMTLFVTLHNVLESDLMVSSNPLSMVVVLFYLLAARDFGSEAAGNRPAA